VPVPAPRVDAGGHLSLQVVRSAAERASISPFPRDAIESQGDVICVIRQSGHSQIVRAEIRRM